MSYPEYLIAMCLKDNRHSWMDWKVDTCGMTEREALKASFEPEWGYEPII